MFAWQAINALLLAIELYVPVLPDTHTEYKFKHCLAQVGSYFAASKDSGPVAAL